MLVVSLILASPAFAYVIFLKDGTQIVARDKYEVDGDQAVFTMPSGVISSIPLAEIDVEKTERENRINLGTARVIEGLETIDELHREAPPPALDTVADLLVLRGDRGLKLPEPRKRQTEQSAGDALPRTAAGYVDLARLPRQPYAADDVAEYVRTYLEGQGFDGVALYQGSSEGQPLVEILTPSEPLVFKALQECANALLQAREQFPDRISGFELLLVAERRGREVIRAGQFQLTPDLADLLAAGRMNPAAFFLRYVEF
ncbi:MAG: hypothetical protein D6696_20505 [Acidobacteria bacterium]|nr:MAG: hypothetical protein D6696_20505 [Acidobacteriota bacterium]